MKSNKHSFDYSNAPPEARVSAESEQRQTNPLLAVLWMTIAFIVGTFVFEVAATGADLDEEIPSTIRLGDALYQDDTTVALATTPLDSLFRIDRNEKLKSAIQHIIETETMWLAAQESMRMVELASHDVSTVDEQEKGPVLTSIPAVMASENLPAPTMDLHVGVPKETQVSQSSDRSRKPRNPSSQVVPKKTDQVIRTAKTLASGVQASPTIAVAEPSESEDTDSSRRNVGRRKAEKKADAKIVRAQPISLVQLAVEPKFSGPTSTSPNEVAESKWIHVANHLDDTTAAPTPDDTPQTQMATIDAPERTAVAAVTPSETVPVIVAPAQVPAQDTAQVPTQDTAQNTAQNTIPDTVQNTAQNTIPDTVQNTAQNTVPDTAQNTAQNTVPDTAQNTAEKPAPAQTDLVMTAPTSAEPQVAPHVSQPIRQPEERIAANWPTPVAAPNQPGVSLNVDSTDVRTVFEMLARGYGMNILVAPDVTGTVTANVEGLTPDQALHGVMKMCDLQAQVEGNVIYVYSSGKMPADATQLRMFPLDFARAEVLEPIVQGLLSPIGNAYASAIDAEDNMKSRESIVVVDTPESIARIESYIHQADQAPRQVMIEARVLEVELKDDLMHGVDLRAIIRGDLTVGSDFLADPISSTTNPLFYAQISGSEVDSLIDLVETTTDAKTLASPRVMVVNGQQAKIQVGQQLGFAVATVTQTSTVQDVQFLDTGVVLSVKPTISRDNKILMDIKPEVSNGQINPDTLLPEEETRELETSVLLNDHQGIVIGGLIQEVDRTVIRKLPWFGDVKYFGKLFQRRETARARSEIIIALVPHIVNIDNQEPQFCDHEQDAIQYQRTQTPLFHGTLKRTCRPWEPRLPDSVGAARHMDVNKLNRKIP